MVDYDKEATPPSHVISRRSIVKAIVATGITSVLGNQYLESAQQMLLQSQERRSKLKDIITHEPGRLPPFKYKNPDVLSRLAADRKEAILPPDLESPPPIDFRAYCNPNGTLAVEIANRYFDELSAPNDVGTLITPLLDKPLPPPGATYIPIIRQEERDGQIVWTPNPDWPTPGWIFAETYNLYDTTLSDQWSPPPGTHWTVPDGVEDIIGYRSNPDVLQIHSDYWRQALSGSNDVHLALPITVQELQTKGFSTPEAYRRAGKIYLGPEATPNPPDPLAVDRSQAHLEFTIITRQIVPLGVENIIHALSGHVQDEQGETLYAAISCWPPFVASGEATHRIIHWATARRAVTSKLPLFS